jgi:hypothetical protein
MKRLSSIPRRPKVRPERIATELVNLTPKSIGGFLKTYGYRLAFRTHNPEALALPSHVVVTYGSLAAAPAGPVNPETLDTREYDAQTGEPIPDKKRELRKWKPPRLDQGMEMRRETYDQLKAIRAARESREKRSEELALLKWAELLRGMWTRSETADALRAIEQIFAAERPAMWDENLKQWIGTFNLERPAVQIARGGYPFVARDLLDALAWMILEASKRGFLRRCENKSCSAPFVAAHPKQRYCYGGCSKEAKKQSKLKWWKRNLSAGARKRSKGANENE